MCCCGGINSDKFSTATYTNAALMGKIPDKTFVVFSDNGTGGLLNFDNGDYTYDYLTATITITSGTGKYRVIY